MMSNAGRLILKTLYSKRFSWIQHKLPQNTRILIRNVFSKSTGAQLDFAKKSKLEENTDGFDENEIFPTSLAEFGYKFVDGKLRHIETGKPYEFEVRKGNQKYNQRRYEALGEIITEYVYDLLKKEAGLWTHPIPRGGNDSEPKSFIFHCDKAFQSEKLIVLIHGSGVVRAGQWSRRLIINDCLDSGTQLPFIERAKKAGYGVVVMNTNDNERTNFGIIEKIRESETPEAHGNYVWSRVISRMMAKHVAIIAHSYGGVVTVNMCNIGPKVIRDRVFAIAMTDSVHSLEIQSTPESQYGWFKEVSRNWVSSHEPLDTPITRCSPRDIKCVSAGTPRHDSTSWSSIDSIFNFIEERYQAKVAVNRRR